MDVEDEHTIFIVGIHNLYDMPYSKGTNADTPFIHNVTMTVADTEYNQELPQGCKQFTIHTRDESEFRLAFVTGKVATPVAPYLTVLANSRYYENDLYIDAPTGSRVTLYFASASAGKIIEIVSWR